MSSRSLVNGSVVSDSLHPYEPARLLCPWNSEYWSGLPFPSPGDLPKRGIKPRSSALQADAFSLSHKKPQNLLGSPVSSKLHPFSGFLFLRRGDGEKSGRANR